PRIRSCRAGRCQSVSCCSGPAVEAFKLTLKRTPRSTHAPGGGKVAQQLTAVSLRDYARIGNNDGAAIGASTYKPAKALLETQRRMGQHVFAERVAAACGDGLALRRGHGLRWNPERKPRDYQRAQRITGHVDPFPVRRRAEQYRVAGVAKALQQSVASILAVNEKRELVSQIASPE